MKQRDIHILFDPKALVNRFSIMPIDGNGGGRGRSMNEIKRVTELRAFMADVEATEALSRGLPLEAEYFKGYAAALKWTLSDRPAALQRTMDSMAARKEEGAK